MSATQNTPDSPDAGGPIAADDPIDAQLEIWRLRDAVIGAEATAGALRARLAEAEHTIATLRRPATRRSRAAGRVVGLIRRLPVSAEGRTRLEASVRSTLARRS